MADADCGGLEEALVETRRQLAADLAQLLAPATLMSLKDEAVAEVARSKDKLLEKAGALAQARADDALSYVKQRAAANPAAALAIGAGLAWRLATHPPIASLLVGAGVYGLMRSDPEAPSRQSQALLRAGEAAASARRRVSDWSAEARDLANLAPDRSAAAWAALHDGVDENGAKLCRSVGSLRDRAAVTVETGLDAFQADRDAYLLGGAALAIAAAIGLSYARRG